MEKNTLDKTHTPSPAHTISVVIPFYNAEHTLNQCLQALARQTQQAIEYIFVDNNSTDRSMEQINTFIATHSELPFFVLTESRPGAAAARNAGVARATGTWILFTDADCIPEPNWIETISKAIPEENLIAGLAGTIQAAPSSSMLALFVGLFTLPALKETRDVSTYTLLDGGFPTANFAVRRDVFNLINGFDVRIPIYGEDHDLCDRLYRAGFHIRTVPAACIHHIHRSSFKGFLKQTFSFGRSHALMLSKQTSGAFILCAPGIRIVRFNTGKRIWLDMNQADKKLIGLLVLGLIWPLLWLLIPFYLVYLSYTISTRIYRRKLNIPERYALPFAFLLVLKSATITIGRIKGSWQYHVVCI